MCSLQYATNHSDFIILPTLFYVVVAAAQLDLAALRREGWLFESAERAGGVEDKWYGFYSYLGEEVSVCWR